MQTFLHNKLIWHAVLITSVQISTIWILFLQAKQKNIESELNDAKTELAEIKLRQQELEARNRLLEKVAELSKAHTTERAEPSLMEVCAASF